MANICMYVSLDVSRERNERIKANTDGFSLDCAVFQGSVQVSGG